MLKGGHTGPPAWISGLCAKRGSFSMEHKPRILATVLLTQIQLDRPLHLLHYSGKTTSYGDPHLRLCCNFPWWTFRISAHVQAGWEAGIQPLKTLHRWQCHPERRPTASPSDHDFHVVPLNQCGYCRDLMAKLTQERLISWRAMIVAMATQPSLVGWNSQ